MKRKFRYLDFTWMYDPQYIEQSLLIMIGGVITIVVAICGAIVWWWVG